MDEQRNIAIRSSVYTRLTPAWGELFPELLDENVEVSATMLSDLQKSDGELVFIDHFASPELKALTKDTGKKDAVFRYVLPKQSPHSASSSAFPHSTSLSQSLHSPIVSLSSSDDRNPGIFDSPTSPRSLIASAGIAVSNTGLNRPVSPTSVLIEPGNRGDVIHSTDSVSSSSQSSSSASATSGTSSRNLRTTQRPSLSPSKSPNQTSSSNSVSEPSQAPPSSSTSSSLAPPRPSTSTIGEFANVAQAIEFYSSDVGKQTIYVSMLSHLRATIPEWVASGDSRGLTNSGGGGGGGLYRSSRSGFSRDAEKLTHSTNPSILILNVFAGPLVGEDGEEGPQSENSKFGEISPKKGNSESRAAVWAKMRADFSTWHRIRRNTAEWKETDSNMTEGEAQREHARQMIVQVLDAATIHLWAALRIRVVFSDIDLSGTEGSMRAVFQGLGPNSKILAREAEVERLNLSDTRTSPRSLLSLHKLSNLQELLLDKCPSIQKSGKNVFSLLLKKDAIPSLTSLSVVGTSQVMSVSWIAEVEQRCPNLKKLYFTRQPGVKALGWSDNVMMQTMRDPLLLPCGHIGDRASLLSLGYCAFDRQAFRVSELASLHPNITLLEKDEHGKWNATIVDAGRRPLDAKVVYHRHCGSFFNLATLTDTYDLESTEVNTDLLDEIRSQTCHYCEKAFGSNTRICYPNSAESSDKHNFANLKDVSTYGSQGLGAD